MDNAYNKTSAYDQMYSINQNIIRYIQSPHESRGYHNNPYSSYLLIRWGAPQVQFIFLQWPRSLKIQNKSNKITDY
jgi:hypothetical protein